MDIVCGIYCIENLINHKKYIGQSIDIYGRWKAHKYELNSNRHRNAYLQRAWNKYGEDNFNFYILEMCDVEILDEREIYYIDTFECTNNKYGYNIETGGNENKQINIDTRIKMSEAAKRRYCSANNPKAHPVYCPQLDRTFYCIVDVENEGLASGSSVKRCLKGELQTAGIHPETGEALTWYSVKQDKEKRSKERKYSKYDSIYCIELDRIFTGGPSQVDREGIASRTCVARCLRGERKSAGKHPITGEKLHWKYTEDNNT